VREQHHPVAAAHELVGQVHGAGPDEDPHEREVPHEGSGKPAAEPQRLRDGHQIVLRDLESEAGKRRENLQAAAHEDEERDGREPVRGSNDPGMLIGGADRRPFACGGERDDFR